MRGLRELGDDWPITAVRGRGLLIAVEFDRDCSAELATLLIDEGLLINTPTASTLRFMPLLVLTEAEADEALEKLERALQKSSLGVAA